MRLTAGSWRVFCGYWHSGHFARSGETANVAKVKHRRSEMTQPTIFISDEAPLELCVVLFPGMTLLDFAGPQCALGLHGSVYVCR
jgi:hypothetical protein